MRRAKTARVNWYADVAQLLEQLIRNQQVIGSSPIVALLFQPSEPSPA
jgi:hypothetical protein